MSETEQSARFTVRIERWIPDPDIADYAVSRRFQRIAERFPDDPDVHWLLLIADAAWMISEGDGEDICWGTAGSCPAIVGGAPHNPVCMTLRRLLNGVAAILRNVTYDGIEDGGTWLEKKLETNPSFARLLEEDDGEPCPGIRKAGTYRIEHCRGCQEHH